MTNNITKRIMNNQEICPQKCDKKRRYGKKEI